MSSESFYTNWKMYMHYNVMAIFAFCYNDKYSKFTNTENTTRPNWMSLISENTTLFYTESVTLDMFWYINYRANSAVK